MVAFSKRLMVCLAQTQLSRNNGGGGGGGGGSDATNEVHVASRWRPPTVPPLPPHLNSAPSLHVHSLLFLPAPFCMRRRLVLFPVCVKHQVGGMAEGRERGAGGEGRGGGR